MNYFAITLPTLIDVILAMQPFNGCDYLQNVEVGKSYDIFSPNLNGIFNRKGMDCRWNAVAPAGYILVLDCYEVYMPLSNNCKDARIEVSASGKSDLTDANRYCGTKLFQAQSVGNRMVIALIQHTISFGGFFKCRLTSQSDISFPCECGYRKKQRIVGGVEAMVNEFPMTAGLVSQNARIIFCGATIIDRTFAITAAHCVMERDVNTLALLVGDHDYKLGNDTKFAALYRLSHFIIHPQYIRDGNKNDIALIQTTHAMTFNEGVSAVCLPFRQSASSEKFINEVVEATGWGATEFSGPLSTTLQKVKLNIISNSQCSTAYPEDGITLNQMCTYTVDKDTYSGDPLLYTEPSNRLLYLVGVVSYGRGCATASPGVNTRVTFYLDWIQSNTPNIRYCVKYIMFKMKLSILFIVLCVPLLLIQPSSAQSCGRRRTSRIVGGKNTGVNEFTMMAGLVQGTVFVFCGATILSNYYVLSSAHCVAGKAANSMQVLVGDYDYKSSADTPYAALYPVQNYRNHPNYNPSINANDITIIGTKYITFNVAVGPVCLPPTNLLFTGSTVEAVGWGTTSYGGPVSSVLKKTSLGVISNAQCNSYYGYIQSGHLCTWASNRDSCQYDSGGPIYVMINGLVNLAGIIVAGNGCGTSYPSICTRITNYVSWIRQYVPGV